MVLPVVTRHLHRLSLLWAITHTNLDGVPAGYRAMADRESLKVMIEP